MLLVAINVHYHRHREVIEAKDRAELERLAEGRLIAAALVLHASRHEGRWPASLEELRPGILGDAVDLAKWNYQQPSWLWTPYVAHRVIAGETNADTDGRIVFIYSGGTAALQRLGD
ncbi:MAG: hypothetical protein D6766_12580 [Verrucomicrobia bacterium]|nr:MAG: hypothetical protein D6766_12580 [Verrucomicrobiota bacterium]